jgi:hypothetical protein
MNNAPANRKPLSNRFALAAGGGNAATQWAFANALTLDPGTLATVRNLGSSTAPVLQFGIPRGEPGDVTAANVLAGNVVVDNLTVGGLLLSSKTVVSGFGGGPRVSQGGWDAPGNSHLITWAALAGNSDNVTGFLTVHVSSKSAARKNGIATVTVVKDQALAPDLMVTALHCSPTLDTFDVGVSGTDIAVATDPECAVCWSFIAAA